MRPSCPGVGLEGAELERRRIVVVMSASTASVFVHDHVRAVQDLYGDIIGADALERSCREQIELLADRLAAGHRAHHPGAWVELHNWHPDLVDRTEADVWDLSLGSADFLGAAGRGHGYADPTDVEGDDTRPSPRFEAVVDAMLRGDLDGLAKDLDDDPTLARGASHWPHRATLLHYATANGVEIYRQVVPSNLPDLVRLIIDHGADVNATSFAYGARQRPLGLLLSSGHPHLAGVTTDVAAILRANGAT